MADTGLPLNVPFPESTDLVRDGAAAIQAVAEALNAPAGAFRYAGTRYYTSSGNFVKADPLGTGDLGIRAIRVRAQGGGGAGGGVPPKSAGLFRAAQGGAGGGYAESFITDIAGLDATVTVTVGDGGTAVPGGDGNPGGDSSFGSLVIGGGGSGGDQPSNSFTRFGGSGTGDLVIQGGSSNYGTETGDIGGNAFAGPGGSSFLSPGAPRTQRRDSGTIAAGDGKPFGGGGSGRVSGTNNQSGNQPGSPGAAGIVIVDLFV